MRRKVVDTIVPSGGNIVTADLSSDAYQLLVVPVGTVTVERFNARDGVGAPVDPQPVNDQGGATPMTGIAAAATVAQRTGVVPYPGCSGFKVSAVGGSCRVVIFGVE